MPKVHMIASEEPLDFPEEGMDGIALCSVLVKKAKPIFMIDLAARESEMESLNTISFCNTCLVRALRPVEGTKYIYGVAEGQKAHDSWGD